MKLKLKKSDAKSGRRVAIKKKKNIKKQLLKKKPIKLDNLNISEEERVVESDDDEDNFCTDDCLTDENNSEDGGCDDLNHKKALDKLKDTDPEFYKYLEENDKSLLEFNDNISDLDDSDEDDGDEKIHKPPNPDELEVNSDEDDFENEKIIRSDKHVTLQMIRMWEDQLTTNSSVGTVTTVVKAFHAALVSITGLDDDDDTPEVYKVDGSSAFNAIVQLCVLHLQPALVRLLKLPTESSALARSQPSKAKKWSKVKSILKLYFTDLLKLLGGVTSDHILGLMLKHIHQMSGFICYYHRIVKLLLRRLVNLWSESSEETVRVLAFLCILRITTSHEKMWLEPALKMMYTSYISNSRFVSPSTLPGINFMRRSLTEILAVDMNMSYHHAFLYIRQLAIHLRNAITLHKKESIQAVYNWQYVNSLHLWSDLLTITHNNHQLRMLLFPLVQIIIGCIKLIPTAQYYPLRFQCCKMLINLSKETGTYIPVLPFILEVLTLTDFDKGHKKLSMKPMDMSCILRLSKSMLQENSFKDAVIEEVYRLLLDSLSTESHCISFPDLTLLPVLQLKSFFKKCKTHKYIQKLRGAVNKIEENAKFIETERKKVSFVMSDKKSIEAWEKTIRAKGTPLNIFNDQLKKICKQQEAKRITENDKVGEFKLPVLKKGEKRRNRDESELLLKLPSDEDDSEDADSLFKYAEGSSSSNEKQKKKIKVIKKEKEKVKNEKNKLSKSDNNNIDDNVNGNIDTVVDFKFSDSE
ncbi:nucleolar complex protein 2 [Lycorma delicatula]|uniref:nucleolar complex protein 2 n=1 Tax=Lycorma delicatula TaxID=130591 RepID=UPI003F510EF6